ncbi:MAG: RsmE family RNA methyltransferase [Candidatus Zixiibacteriota bacterium]
MIQTFTFNPSDKDGDRIILSGPEAKHISSVLRLGKGDTVRLIDGTGEAHICEITELAQKSVICGIIKTTRNSGEAALSVTLAVGISTASKFDTVLEKGTEVGICRFVPLLTEKAKVKLENKSAIAKKLDRWNRVCEAAAKQSGRSKFPAISEPMSLADFISTINPEQAILFHPESETTNLNDFINTYNESSITVITGPESGFSKGEIELIKGKNIPIITLGDRILRTETAAIVCPSLLIYFKESFKG